MRDLFLLSLQRRFKPATEKWGHRLFGFFGLLLCLRGGGQQSVDFLALIRSIERVGLGVSLSEQTPFHEKKRNFQHIPFCTNRNNFSVYLYIFMNTKTAFFSSVNCAPERIVDKRNVNLQSDAFEFTENFLTRLFELLFREEFWTSSIS